MFPYSFTGVTAELFAAAAKAGVPLQSTGPAENSIWVLLADGWHEAPREAMPLLLGITDLEGALEAVLEVDGVLVALSPAQRADADMLVLRAGIGGGRCR